MGPQPHLNSSPSDQTYGSRWIPAVRLFQFGQICLSKDRHWGGRSPAAPCHTAVRPVAADRGSLYSPVGEAYSKLSVIRPGSPDAAMPGVIGSQEALLDVAIRGIHHG